VLFDSCWDPNPQLGTQREPKPGVHNSGRVQSPGAKALDDPADKVQRVLVLLPRVFQWARSVHPTQPLTSGVWQGDWSSPGKLSPMEKIQLDNSDVISFHSYDPADEFERRVKSLAR
jgi:hypothetical protein